MGDDDSWEQIHKCEWTSCVALNGHARLKGVDAGWRVPGQGRMVEDLEKWNW